MRSALVVILKGLLARGEHNLSLDAIGDAIGAEAITQAEIEALFDALEAAGRTIDATGPNVRQNLKLVLSEARRLRALQPSNPDIKALAHATKLTEREVRAALLYASVLGR